MNYIILFIAFFSSCYSQQTVPANNKQTIVFETKDNVQVTADLYQIEDKTAPYIILFHQAGYSRGEYIEIAPRLNKLGFNCIAIDQRSGKEVNGIVNQTNKFATNAKLKTKYINAVPDMEAALAYVKNELKATKIIVWGSSYSASLVLYLASQNPKSIAAVLSFSPGEYFEINNQKIESFCSKIECAVFITSAKNERNNWQSIYDKISSEKQFFLPETKGFHGSKALWSTKEGNKEYWEAVTQFLIKI